MTLTDLERELEFCESMALTHRVWRSAAAELRRVVRPKTLGRRLVGARVARAVVLPPAELNALASSLSAEIQKIDDGRHLLYLALSGALLARGISTEVLPALVAAVARDANDAKVANRVSDAESTVRAWEREARVTGYSTLKTDWPEVAAVIDNHLPPPASMAQARVEEQLSRSEDRGTVSLASAEATVFEALERACSEPDTLQAVALPPGVGKTHAAVEFALSLDRKVAIVHPTNDVAKAHRNLTETLAPGSSSRHFGVLSVVGPDGKPVCRKAALASTLQRGGLPVQQRLCIRCPHKDDCEAFGALEGDAHARIGFFNHAMVDAAIEHVGAHGLLVLDEAPPFYLHEVVPLESLETLLRLLRSYVFPSSLSAPSLPLVELLLAESDLVADGDQLGGKLAAAAATLAPDPMWLRDLTFASISFNNDEQDELDSFDAPHPVVAPGPSGEAPKDAVAFFLAAVEQWPNHPVPPTTSAASRDLASGRGPSASDIAGASRTLATLARAVRAEAGTRARWQVDDQDRASIVVAYENAAVARALRRQGPTVLLDATLDESALRAVSRRSTEIVAERVVDGAPTKRILLARDGASKRHLAPRKAINWKLFGAQLADGIARVGASARTILVITHKACAEALQTTHRNNVPHVRLRGLIARHLRRGGRLVVGHFGNLRGRNEFDGVPWNELDAIITIGDPWPDVGRVSEENTILGFSLEESDDRLRDLAAAELAQAHGRLRAPRQTKPTTAVHVGSIVPWGWCAADTIVEQSTDGRPPNVGAMTVEELRVLVGFVGGLRALARATSVSDATVRRYLTGRSIPEEFAAKVRSRFQVSSR